MAQFKVKGGKALTGEISAAGNKNAALPLMAASLVTNSPVTLTNVPIIRDVMFMAQILEGLGVKVEGVGTNILKIDPSGLSKWETDPTLMSKFRASVLLAAPLLARFKKATITPPGGDSIGERLLDTHFSLLHEFGVTIDERNGVFELDGANLKPAEIFLEEASVTATAMGLILGANIEGNTVIEDAAAEPHIQDLAQFLSKTGADIIGGGTNILNITGKKELIGTTHRVIDDHIDVGTFAIAAALTGGHITINEVTTKNLKMILAYLGHLGVQYKTSENQLEIMPGELAANRKTFQTRPWPGFPTDLMSPFIVLATQSKGTVICHDWMYEWRIFFVDHLIKMGADITIADPHRIVVNGPTKLRADNIPSNDIRAGSALVLAALGADGESTIEHAEIIDRGYEDLDGRLAKLGAEITRVE
ncbi:UDP-N-acetylglucosamine 1-carboxyvinyltransferase [Candidatus Microgenomates bacterium]|nr:UDP-N-acetylglucosamine 1-carboxyvinyltransferase [Candidatus Microgenomates bacterium]